MIVFCDTEMYTYNESHSFFSEILFAVTFTNVTC